MSTSAESNPFLTTATGSSPRLAYAYTVLVLFMVSSLLIWQGINSVRTFEGAQRQIAMSSVNGTANEIEVILHELHRSAGIFADEKSDLLRHIARHPEDLEARSALDRSVRDHFPEVFAYALSNETGRTLVEEKPQLIGSICRMDIQDFVLTQVPQDTRIHANANGSHFDIMTTVPDPEDRNRLVFFISMTPDMLSRVLENSQAPGHRLYLLLADIGIPYIEVSDQSWASVSGRPEPGFLIAAENTLFMSRIPETRWDLVDVIDPALVAARVRNTWVQGSVLFLAILATTMLMLYLLQRSEKLRSRAQVSLRESHATLSALVEGVADGVYLKDIEGRYRLVNDAYANWTERDAPELIGRTDREVLPEHTASLHEREDAQVTSTSTPSTVEEDDPHRQGRTALVSRTPYLDASGRVAGLVGIRHDITELKQARERLHHHEMELAHIDRLGMMGELATSLAHELNQPLGAISNYANACLRIVRQGRFEPELLAAGLEDTVAQAKRAGEIIRKARAFVRKDRQHPECTDLAELIGDALDLAGSRAFSKGIRVDVDVAPGVPRVRCDRHQIEQVILNLMFNAMEAMSPGPGKVGIDVRRDESNQVRVTVSDNGPGLAPETAGRIFEAFHTTKPDGTGMGLALCRSIVESHSGHIWADEPAPGGARFHFTVPEDDECTQQTPPSF